MRPESPNITIEVFDKNQPSQSKVSLPVTIGPEMVRKPPTDGQHTETIIRSAKTLGQLEWLAGIATNEDRRAFWLQFSHLRNRARKVGEIELRAIIRAKLNATPEDNQAQSIRLLKLVR